MKIILLRDVAKVGRRYEVKDLADGFARNFIIARGLGCLATPTNLQKIEKLKKTTPDQTNYQPLDQITIQLTAKANENGHLFASLHVAEIARELKREHGIVLDPKLIDLEEPLKTVGEHRVRVNYDAKTSTFLTVLVRPS